MMKNRDISTDIACGLLIIHMIVSHCFQIAKCDETAVYMDYSRYLFFFMPWFFYKSGRFYKPLGLKENLITRGRDLLNPYIFFSVIGMVIDAFILVFEGKYNIHEFIRSIGQFFTKGSTYGNLPLWFLLSLFLSQALFNFIYIKIISKRKNRETVLILGLVIILSGLAYLLNRLGFTKPYYISNMITGTLFYTLGYLCRYIRMNSILVISAFIIYLASVYSGFHIVGMFTNSLISGKYLLWILSALSGIIVIDFVCKKLPCFHYLRLEYIGAHSMNFYVVHWIVLILVSFMVHLFYPETSNHFMLICLIISSLIILPILNFFIIKYKVMERIKQK